MPGGDRTGPLGEGPMTGRQMGPCAEGGEAGAMYPAWGRRHFGRRAWGPGPWMGRGRGFRHGYRHWAGPGYGPWGYARELTAEEHAAILRRRAIELRHELSAIEEDLASFENEANTQGE